MISAATGSIGTTTAGSLPVASVVSTLVAPWIIERREEILGEPDDRSLLCETIVTAISPGTELAAFTGAAPLRDGITYPRLVGYCNVSRILRCGGAVTKFKPGDRVLTFSSHRTHFLIREDDVPATVPEGMNADHAACTYLFHLGYNAVLRSDIRAGSRVVVLGLGVLGLTTVAMASLAGADVMGVTDHAGPAGLATQFGAKSVHSRSAMAALADKAAVAADVVVSTTNGWDDWAIALKAAGMRGTIAVLGFPGRDQPPPGANPLDSRSFYAKQLRIEAVGVSPERPDLRGFTRFNVRENLAFLLGLIAEGRLDATKLISGEYAAENIATAYDDLLSRKNSPVTYLLRWSRD